MCDRILKKLLAGIVLSLAMLANADTEIIDGIEWTYRVENYHAIITGMRVTNNTSVSSKEVSIPSKLGVSSVTKIGNGAFSREGGLTSVSIPAGVTDIGCWAFNTCTGLVSIVMPGTVTNIEDYSFAYCSSLCDLRLPFSLRKIGRYAFDGCSGLKAIEMPIDLESVGYGAFMSCSSLTSAVQATSMLRPDKTCRRFGEYAFRDCKNLVKYEFPEIVEEIPMEMFGNCEKLEDIKLPHSLISISRFAFNGCSGLKSLHIPSGVTRIGEYAFQGCKGLKDVVLPSKLTEVSDGTFNVCSGLTSVSIPASVTNIGKSAFALCDNLSAFQWPHNVAIASEYALWWCQKLRRVSFPSTLSEIREFAINACPLDRIDFAGEMPYSEVNCVSQRSSCLVHVPIGVSSWRGVDKWQGMTVVHDCKAGDYVTATLDNGVLTISGNGNIYDYIDEAAPWALEAVTNVVVESGVTGIGANSFSGMKDLRSVEIFDTVTSIDDYAFSKCGGLTNIVFHGNSPDIGQDVFFGTPRTMTLTVGADTVGWDDYDLLGITPPWGLRSVIGHQTIGGKDPSKYDVRLAVTNVVVHYVLNSIKPDIAVPVGDDTGFVSVITEVTSSGAVSVPSEWKDNFPTFEDNYGMDFGKAMTMKSGKKDGAGNEMFVWQDYVAGTDPTDENSKFTASVTIVGGKPVVSYSPELSEAEAAKRVYTTWGKAKLQDAEWTVVPAGSEADYNFFKVTVEMK